ncbi:titin homolog [Cydia strobilella]|uniref:titin homolog n=1 Tax=Cydia strobilella TaxID=1100964 RepID=UPI003003E251
MRYGHHSLGSYLSMLFLVLHFTFHLLGFTRCSLVFDEANQEAMKNKYCSRVGDCLPGTHVMCMYGDKKMMGPRCSGGKMLPLTADEKTDLLDLLNELRRNLAQGIGDLPKAYGMRKLFWDDSLAEFAQAWANQCDPDRHDLCRASEKFPRAGQAMYPVRFNYNDWSIKREHFDDKSKNLTPEKRTHVIERFAGYIHRTSKYVNKQQIEKYPSGDFMNEYLTAVHGTTTNVGCGMSTFHDYYRTSDNEPVIFHAVEIVCNFSNRPTAGEKVYETKWSDGKGWTTCGCPDGFIEEDCLCVPGKRPDNKDDQQNKDKDDQQNKDKDDQQNKDKDDQQNKEKDDQQSKDKDGQQNKDKDDQQNKDKDDQQNKDKDDQQNKEKDDQQSKDKDDQQNKDKDNQQNKDKDDQQNKDKDDQQNKDKDDQQSKDKDDQQNKDKDDQQSKDKDDQQNKDKDDQQSKDKDGQQNKDKDNQQNKDKDDQQNKDKDDQQNKDMDDQQSKDKDDQQNKDKDDQQSKNKDDQQNKDKDDQQSKDKDDQQNKDKDDQQKEGKDD